VRSRPHRSPPTTTGRARTLYTPPKKGQKTAALHVVGRADLPDCAKRVFSALVWHANQTDGRCDPSHELLLHGAGLKSPTSVSKGLAALMRAGFIIEVRKARPHYSAAYQINWPLLSELQRRWEEGYAAVMAERRRARDTRVKTRRATLRTFKPSDILTGQRKARSLTSPHERGGNTAMSVAGNLGPNSPTSVGVNSLEPCENNSVRRDEPSPLRRGSPRLADPMCFENQKQGLQRQPLSDASQKTPGLLRAIEGASRRAPSAEQADPLSTVEEDLRLQAPELYGKVVEWVPNAVIESALAAEREKSHSGAPLILGAYRASLAHQIGARTPPFGDVAIEQIARSDALRQLSRVRAL